MAVTLRVIGGSAFRTSAVSWTMKGKAGRLLEVGRGGDPAFEERAEEAPGDPGGRFGWALLEAEYLWRGLQGEGVEDHQLEGAECLAVADSWRRVDWEDPWMVPLLKEVVAGKMSQVRSWREMAEDLGRALAIPGDVDPGRGLGGDLAEPYESPESFLRGALRLLRHGLKLTEDLSRRPDLGPCRFMISEVLAHESMAFGVVKTLAAAMGVEEDGEWEGEMEDFQVRTIAGPDSFVAGGGRIRDGGMT